MVELMIHPADYPCPKENNKTLFFHRFYSLVLSLGDCSCSSVVRVPLLLPPPTHVAADPSLSLLSSTANLSSLEEFINCPQFSSALSPMLRAFFVTFTISLPFLHQRQYLHSYSSIRLVPIKLSATLWTDCCEYMVEGQ